ncbi:HigA family addiction module antitoxin [Nitrosomonas aestuarii]|uniref:HigA family addiction module antitoxin n=1 Tax=Nitrosomonas aestuarii TaxID=52441 RepID=UPI000D2F60FF|nr:HigA family addiction module antitoxin [Nitrosomonas aestuarii]MCP5244225.1 HigA family addiction module antidote protein [Burkholderiales bacterium]PTN08616.1 addiction module HigA family antidote [Nitrosomonas aestuarii]
MTKRIGEPIHPGEILADELEFIGINAGELAKKIDVPKNRIYQIVNGERSVTADTALRLGKFFGTGPRIWLNLQKAYELDVASKQIGNALKDIATYDHQTA